MNISAIKKQVFSITGVKVHVRDHGSFFTVSLADATKDHGFGYFINELKAAFNITRLDGASFNIAFGDRTMLETTAYPRPNATYLQGVARYVTGVPAGDLKVGDSMVWNGGEKTKVYAIHDVSKSFVVVDEIDQHGKVWPGRKLKKTRIIARPINEIK